MREGSPRIIVVPPEAAGLRLDQWLPGALAAPSRSAVQKLCASGAVFLNGKTAKAKILLQGNETITVWGALSGPRSLQPAALPLDILFEDASVLVLNKSAGIAMHPGAGQTETTLVEGVLAHCPQLGQGGDWPGIVHRLDRDTTGAVVFAKTDAAYQSLRQQFNERSIIREYVALLDGVLPQAVLEHESYLHRHPKQRLKVASMSSAAFAALHLSPDQSKSYRRARTRFTTLNSYCARLSLVAAKLYTGRTHQIRVHSLDLGCPVLGDPLYNKPCQLPHDFAAAVRQDVASLRRQMLHARSLGFHHPERDEIVSFQAELPSDFSAIIEKLQPYAVPC